MRHKAPGSCWNEKGRVDNSPSARLLAEAASPRAIGADIIAMIPDNPEEKDGEEPTSGEGDDGESPESALS